MKTLGLKLTVIAALVASAASLPAAAAASTPAGTGRPPGTPAQARPARPPAEAPPAPPPPSEVQFDPDFWGRQVFRIGQDYTLRAGSAVRDVAVVYGDAAIDGRVGGDVLVVLGTARVSSTAVIEGNLVVVGGSAVVSEGAQVRRDLFVVGSTIDAPPGFTPGGAHLVIGPASLRGQIDAFIPWVTHGLLWGRLIVPGLPWVWAVVGIFFLVYLALSLLFDYPVRSCAATLADRPLSSFLVGVVVLLLAGPVCLLLAVSVVGIAVVPFVLCALFVAGLLGKVGVARWIGMRVVPQPSLESRPQSLRSFIIGFAMITLAYIVPLLGFVVWTLVGVLGLGAATLAFMSGYRRENPVPPRRVAPSPPPPAAPPAPAYATSSMPAADGQYEAMVPPDPSQPAMAVAAPPFVSDVASLARAGFRDRLAAFVLDVILVVIAAQPLDLMRHDSVFFLLLLVYHIGFWTWKGTTVGGIICQLRLVRVDGAPLRFIDALVRGLSAIFSLAVLGIGCLWMIRDPESQTWHDRIAGTWVVKVPRNWPL